MGKFVRIEIEMEMPKNCSDCRFNGTSSCWNGGFCQLKPDNVIGETSAWTDKRAWWCPLEELKDD